MSETITAEILKKSISYYYLLSFCPPEQLEKFKKCTAKFLKSLLHESKIGQEEFFSQVIPQVFHRIVGFHEDSRDPNNEIVEALSEPASKALESKEYLQSFQAEMIKVSELGPRVKPENRLHRKKGCDFCRQPCRYGYFTLVSEPRFNLLQKMFNEESRKPTKEQSASRLVSEYTGKHLDQFYQSETLPMQREHFGNLAFCLLMLSMAKSRKAIPVDQIKTFQDLNQRKIAERS
jgi:hypothetical protein